MRCPKCGYVSFDDLDRCKRCGQDLSALQKERRPLVVSRPQRASRTESAARPVEPRPVKLPDFQKKIAQTDQAPPAGRPADDTALRREQENLRRQMDIIDQDRQRLHRASHEFDQRQQLLEKKLREEIASERRAAQDEMNRMRETQADLHQELAALEHSRRSAEETFRALAADRERLQQQQAELADRREQIRREEEQARQLAQEVRRLSEVSVQLKEERESLRREQEAANRAREEAERLRREAEIAKVEAEKARAEAARIDLEKAKAEAARLGAEKAQAEKTAAPAARAYNSASEREYWRASLKPENQPTADDFVKMLGRRQRVEQPSRPPVAQPAAPLAPPRVAPAAEFVVEEEELLEDGAIVLEEIDETPELPEAHPSGKPHPATPKAGLGFRLIAGLVDFSLLLLVLGVFLVIGRLATGGSGHAAQLIATLSLPFYLLFVLLALVYVTYLHGSGGQTLGKRMLGLRLMTTHGERVGYVNAFLRFVAACFSVALLGLGVLWIGLDPNKQGWHDKIARTVVVRL